MISRWIISLPLFILLASPAWPQAVPEEKARAVRETIEAYVKKDTELKGSFLLQEAKNQGVHQLKFDHVHTGVEKKGDAFFACVDFVDHAGKVYDVDVYVTEADQGLSVDKIVPHKIDGVDVR